VFYHPFESWATKSEWQAELGANENIKGELRSVHPSASS